MLELAENEIKSYIKCIPFRVFKKLNIFKNPMELLGMKTTMYELKNTLDKLIAD